MIAIFNDFRVVLELVRTREFLPAADLQVGSELDVDLEFDAVGLDVAFFGRAGVHREQHGLDVAVAAAEVLQVVNVFCFIYIESTFK